jgi:hypothetical protein
MNKLKISKKLFPGSIVALLLGVFLASPLLYTNIALAPATVGPEPLLGVEVTYAYIEQITGTYVPYGGFLPDSQNPNATEPGFPRTNYFFAYNFTRLSEEVDPCDAKFMVYLIKFYSDKGFIGNLAEIEGIIYNMDRVRMRQSENVTAGSLYPFETDEGIIYYSSYLWDIYKNDELFGDHQPFAEGGSFGIWDVGESRAGGKSGFWDSAFEEPESIFVSVSLLGWIALRGNSTDTIVLEEPEVVAEAQLEKFGDGFLYNTLIPEDELSEFDPDFDPLNPLWKLFDLEGDSN